MHAVARADVRLVGDLARDRDEKAPVDVVVAVPSGVLSNSTATVSLAPNPFPDTLTLVVGGPDVGFTVIVGAAVACAV